MSNNNQLLEAAAEILSGSKKSAPAMPPEKLAGTEAQDLGGPTPQNSKPTDDSNKIHAGEKAPNNSGHNKSTIGTKASDASGKTVDHLKKEEAEETFDADIDAIFEDNVSDEFKQKAATIFEARVFDRVASIQEEIETRYAGMLEEAVEQIQTELAEKVNDYLSYVVEQWAEDNKLAIESGLRTELAEEFIAGMRNLFAEHYIDVPADKVDLVDELAEKVVELESKLDEEIERGMEFKKALVESTKAQITHEVCEGLTVTQVEKIKSLAEGVEFSTEEEYKEKLETIRENYFPSGVKKADEEQLHENVADLDEPQKAVINDPFVAAVSQAISKTTK